MTNSNLKLLSVRIHPDIIQAIDNMAEKHPYWKRNTIIANVLATVFTDFSDAQIYDMVRRNHFRQEPVTAEFRINRVQLPSSAEDHG